MAEPTKLDRFLSRYLPGLAWNRAVSRHNLNVLASTTSGPASWSRGYRGGKTGRIRATVAGGSAPEDAVGGFTYENMRDNAMQLYRDDPMTRSIVNVCSTYMGESRPTATTTGADGKPSEDSKAWNKAATSYFNDYWWTLADARKRPGVDFGEFQVLFDRWSWLGGDMLYLLFDGMLLPYEGTQIQTPHKLRQDKQITNGVRVQKAAPFRISHYYLTEGDGLLSQRTFKRIRQSECIYSGSRKWRNAMLRSVPDLHGVIDALYAFGDTTDNVQQRIRFESRMWTVERKGAVGNMPGSKLIDKDSSKGTQVEHTPAEWGTRLKINGKPGEDFQFQQMQNPHASYVDTMEHMARIIAAGTGFPYEIVMHVYTNGSYTANRAARLDFAKALLARWAWRNKVHNQRVWNWAIAKAMKAGDIPQAPVDARGISQWYKVAWTLPHFPHIDEGKEVIADIKQWGCGQESIADWAQQKGQTRDQLLDAHDADIQAMKERAEALEIPLEQYMGQLFSARQMEQSPVKGQDNGKSD